MLVFLKIFIKLLKLWYFVAGRESSENSPQPLPWNKPAHLRSLDTSALALSPRANLSSDPLASHSRRGLMPLAPLAPLDSGLLDM